MPAILKRNNGIFTAKNLIESVGRTTPAAENLYLFFGKASAWTDENTPDTPTESITIDTAARNDIIGIKKITQADLAFVVPRHTWTTGTVYTAYSAGSATLFSQAFYVITSNFNVYKCLNNNSNAQSIVEPTGTSTSPISTGDGYQWKFMYNLSTSMITNFLTTDWLPVPYGGQKTSFQTAVETSATYSNGTPPGGHGYDAVSELGANRIMISQILNKDESGVFPVNDDYRQFGLLLNPRLLSNNAIATGSAYIVNDSNSNIDPYTGQILYIDNRKAIARSSEQSESFKLILAF